MTLQHVLRRKLFAGQVSAKKSCGEFVQTLCLASFDMVGVHSLQIEMSC
jgi:hypothetical protein